MKVIIFDLDQHGYEHANLLNCMTLDVENLHSVVHHKSLVSTAFQYARKGGFEENSMVVCLLLYLSWLVVYGRSLGLFDIPVMQQPPALTATSGQIEVMREWSRTYGASVRQRSVRQVTTMARAGTLPDYLYQKVVRVGDKVDLNEENEGSEWHLPKSEINSTDNQEDELSEYDSSSEEEDNADDAPSEENHGNAKISRDVNFWVGATTIFGRSVRFNRRLVLWSRFEVRYFLFYWNKIVPN